MSNRETLSRRNLLKGAGLSAGLAVVGLASRELPVLAENSKEFPWENGEYQTFPRSEVAFGGIEIPVLHKIDIGTLGPDVDAIFGIDFQGDIPTGALVIHMPEGKVEETRVVGIKRTSVETVQFKPALGGDRFDVYQISKFGGNEALDEMARKHGMATAREHQKVVYVGDLGRFEKEWGAKEAEFLTRIIRAQRPEPGIPRIAKPDFVQDPRVYR